MCKGVKITLLYEGDKVRRSNKQFQVNGCAHLSNIMIRHYQSSRRVNLSPVPYNRIVLAIEGIAVRFSLLQSIFICKHVFSVVLTSDKSSQENKLVALTSKKTSWSSR